MVKHWPVRLPGKENKMTRQQLLDVYVHLCPKDFEAKDPDDPRSAFIAEEMRAVLGTDDTVARDAILWWDVDDGWPGRGARRFIAQARAYAAKRGWRR